MLIEFPPLKLWKSLTHSWGVAWALGKPCCQDSFLKALDSWRGWGGRRTIIFHRLQPLQEDACSNGHVSLVYWLRPFLLRNSFVFSKCNLCCTWSSDNADDPAFDVQSSLLRYCCPLLGSSPILVGEKKKKKKETMETNLDTDGKRNEVHCPPQTPEATPTRRFPVTFSGILSSVEESLKPKVDDRWLTWGSPSPH